MSLTAASAYSPPSAEALPDFPRKLRPVRLNGYDGAYPVHNLAQKILPPCGGEHVGKLHERLVALVVTAAEHGVHRLALVTLLLSVGEHVERRGHAYLLEILLNERAAERVYGAYPCRRQPVQTVAEHLPRRAVGRARRLVKRGLEPVFQFGRGRLVVHQNEHLRKRHPRLHRNEYLFHHSGGLAAACGRGHQHFAVRPYRVALLVGEHGT